MIKSIGTHLVMIRFKCFNRPPVPHVCEIKQIGWADVHCMNESIGDAPVNYQNEVFQSSPSATGV